MKTFINILLTLVILSGCNMPDPMSKQVVFEPNTKSDLISPNNGLYDIGFHSLSKPYKFKVRFTNPGKLPALNIQVSETNLGSSPFRYSGDSGEYPGEKGNCGNDLPSNESCEIEFIFIGNEVGQYDKIITLSFNNGIAEILTREIHLTARSGYPADLEVIDEVTAPYDYGEVEPLTKSNHLFKLKNSGDMDALNLSVTFATENSADKGVFSFNGGKYPGTNGTCGTVLGWGQTCLLDIIASPIRNELEVYGKFSVFYTDPTLTKSIDTDLKVKARELAAKIKVSIDKKELEAVVNNPVVGSRPEFTITFENIGYNKATELAAKTFSELQSYVSEISNTCNSELLVNESCQKKFSFSPNYPIETTFPKKEEFVDIIFSYNDQKRTVETEPLKLNTLTQQRGHLIFYKGTETTNPMLNNESLLDVTDNVSFSRDDMTVTIGSSTKTQEILIYNGRFPNERIEVSNMTFEIIPNNGYLKLDCLESNSCPKALASSMYRILYLKYSPKNEVPYNTDQDYQLKVTYNNGADTKSYTIDIPTRDVPIPVISVDVKPLDNESHVLPSLPNKNHIRSSVILIENSGASPVLANYTIKTPNSYFSIDSAKDNCTGKVLQRYENCTFQVDFMKNTKDTPFGVYDEQRIDFITNNGLDANDDNYQILEYSINRAVVDPSILSFPDGSVEFEAQEVSLPSARGFEPYYYNETFTVNRVGLWNLTDFSYEIIGPDKDSFVIDNITPTINGLITTDILVEMHYVVPETVIAKNAQLVMRYHGSGEEQAEPLTELIIDLNGHAGGLNPSIAIEKGDVHITPSGTPIYYAAAFPLVSKGVQAETQKVKIRNEGHVTASSYGEVLNLRINGSPNNEFVFGNRLGTSSASCTILEVVDDQYLKIDIGPNGDFCEIEVNFTPPTDGPHIARVEVDYLNTSSYKKYSWVDCLGNSDCDDRFSYIWGSGIPWAKIDILPNRTGGLMFVDFGEPELNEQVTKEFIVEATADGAKTGTLLTIPTVESWGVGDCTNTQIVSSKWSDYERIDGLIDDFEFFDNTCVTNSEFNFGDKCGFKVKFTPRLINKLSGMCVYITYKRYPEDTEYETKRAVLIGNSKAPDAIFNGWREVLAEGQSINSNQFVNIKWKPITTKAPDKTNIVGYNVYRRKFNGVYPDHPINSDLVDPTEIENIIPFIQYTDNEISESDPDYPLLEAGEVYMYRVEGVFNINNNDGLFPLKSKEGDQEIRVIMPTENMALMHRLTVNTRTCLQELGKTPVELFRFLGNSCPLDGIGSANSRFDIESDIIIDKFENKYSSGEFSNAPGIPYLFDDVDTAINYCDSRQISYPSIVQNDIHHTLLNRNIFMLASVDIERPGDCNTNGPSLIVTDRSGRECTSKYGIQDLLGNAWEWTTNYMNYDDPDFPSWNFENFDLSNTYKRPNYSIEQIDPDSLDLDWDFIPSWGSRYEYTNISTPCISPLTGLSFKDVASVCPAGTYLLNDFKSKMDIIDYQDYIHITKKVFDGLSDDFEDHRYLMVGGSFSSIRRLDIPSSRWSLYWGLPNFEKVFQNGHDEPYTGGGARCFHKVKY